MEFSSNENMKNQARHARCPSCSGNLRFVVGTQLLRCDSCDSSITVEDYENIIGIKNKKGVGDRFTAGATKNDEHRPEFKESYTCSSCGGQLSPGVLSVTDTCPFCGNDIVFTDKFRKHRMPDFIIPFKKDRNDFLETYKKRLKKRIMIPDRFRKTKPEDIIAMYYPYWIYDVTVKGYLWFRKEHETIRRNCFSSGVMAFSGIPQDASRKLDDRISQSLEPYSMSNAKPFSFAYLSGMNASVHDVDQKAAIGAVTNRIHNTVDDCLLSRLNPDFWDFLLNKRRYTFETSKISCAMFPIWSMDIKWKNQTYNFSMNGETGKFTEHFPYSICKLISCILTVWFFVAALAALVYCPGKLPSVFHVCSPHLKFMMLAVLGCLLPLFSARFLFRSNLRSFLSGGLFTAAGMYFLHLVLLVRNTDNSINPHIIDTLLFSCFMVAFMFTVAGGFFLKKIIDIQNIAELKADAKYYLDESRSKLHCNDVPNKGF